MRTGFHPKRPLTLRWLRLTTFFLPVGHALSRMGARTDTADDPDIAEREESDVEDRDFEPAETRPSTGSRQPSMSPRMSAYFSSLQAQLDAVYAVARAARAKGLDPEIQPEIPMAEDLAQRVEELVGPAGIAERIRGLSPGRNREELSLVVAKEVSKDVFSRSQNKEAAVDQAVRTGLAILTEGILVAPLEGVAAVKVKRNSDGTDYVDILYAGPIRAAGGTAQALSLLIADVVRRDLGIGRYHPTPEETERYKEEVQAYKHVMHLQYNPTPQEIELIVKGCPVCIDGEGTEDEEVSGYRNLPRVETNKLRGGMCLVLSDGMILKASKILKHVKNLKMDGWEFIETFTDKGKQDAAGLVTDEQGRTLILADPRYMAELTAGRPVIAHPSRKGGFRLRYGRSRTCGIASTAIHPAVMVLCDDFLAIGTQMKIERPGKATVVTPCDGIEGPTVLLDNGDLVQVQRLDEARSLHPRVRRIVDLGEILIPFGEFAENNKPLSQGAYAPEWWLLEAQRELGADARRPSTFDDALALSHQHPLPLHPDHNLFWHDLRASDVARLSAWVEGSGAWERREAGNVLLLPLEPAMKDLLVELGALHRQRGQHLELDRHACPLLLGLGLEPSPSPAPLRRVRRVEDHAGPNNALALVNHLAGVVIRPRAPTRIGARMGRPEKAAERKMSPPVHSLFPLGHDGGIQRLVKEAAKGTIKVEVGKRRCAACGNRGTENRCACGAHTLAEKGRPEETAIPLGEMLERAKTGLGLAKLPETIKGVMGLISATKTPEPLEKGILRAKHDVYCFKDGTIRYDMTDVPLTHFRPREIGTPVDRLGELGYTHDVEGKPLERDDQLVELFVQDVVASKACGTYFKRAADFLDELLVKFYGLEPFYRAQGPEDLIGASLAGLAPHTSGGVACRLIGYTPAHVMYAHPFFHAAKRRNCDGDEDCVMLLLDGLLNFSRSYLPQSRGGLMDAPLSLSTRIDPNELDKEALNLDSGEGYPLAFYEATARHASPKEVESLVDRVASRLGTPSQYEGIGCTHPASDANAGVHITAYKSLGKMTEKVDAQLALAAKIRAVDVENVAARVIESHLLPDLVGNLKAFTKQKVRCTKCSSSYRRVPLKGVCLRCGNTLTMTVYEASVKKYLDVSKRIAERYGVKPYTKQRIDLAEEACMSLFTNDKVKKPKLTDFL